MHRSRFRVEFLITKWMSRLMALTGTCEVTLDVCCPFSHYSPLNDRVEVSIMWQVLSYMTPCHTHYWWAYGTSSLKWLQNILRISWSTFKVLAAFSSLSIKSSALDILLEELHNDAWPHTQHVTPVLQHTHTFAVKISSYCIKAASYLSEMKGGLS